MRLVDAVLRQGHLSEQALTEALVTGNRPAHLDQCDLCAERGMHLSRWLDGIRETSDAAVDRAFSSERLAAQQSQIMRRLEQVDEPSRVIAFPAANASQRDVRRRVAPAWVAAAAAAGVVLGVAGTQVTSYVLGEAGTSTAPVVQQAPQLPGAETPASNASAGTDFNFNELNDLYLYVDRAVPPSLNTLDDATPAMVEIVSMAARRQ